MMLCHQMVHTDLSIEGVVLNVCTGELRVPMNAGREASTMSAGTFIYSAKLKKSVHRVNVQPYYIILHRVL